MTEPFVVSHGSALVQSLFNFRDSLITLKEDRTTYIKSADVVGAYDQLCELLHTHEERFGEITAENEATSLRPTEQQECKTFSFVSCDFCCLNPILDGTGC
jgi:hypothetical protein